MAIIFISPREKQKTFFKAVIILLVIALVTFLLVAFIPDFINKTPEIPLTAPSSISGAKPDIAINFTIVDSDKFKNLESFAPMESQFTYVVEDQKGKQISGTILAVTGPDAKRALESAGFKVVSVKEASVGRSEPFVSY